MENQKEKDFLWDFMIWLSKKYGYNTRLVVGDNKQFQPFILMNIPITERLYGYISLHATDIEQAYEIKGEKFVQDTITKLIDLRLEQMRRKFGDI